MRIADADRRLANNVIVNVANARAAEDSNTQLSQ